MKTTILVVGRLCEAAGHWTAALFRRLTESAYSRTVIVLLFVFAPLGTAEEAATNSPAPQVATNAVEAKPTTTAPLTVTAPTNEPTIVTSEHLVADYLHNVGTFEGNVLAVDPRMTVRADKMTVFFGSTNIVSDTGTNTTRSIQKIIADGGVVINTPDNKTAHSDHAEYTADEGKVVLTGKPRVESPDGVVIGQKITFWRGSEKMDVVAGPTETNRTKLIIYPEEQRKKE
ncbi:MAG TPA: LptA/OstA family protein [Verrucomicrobiae bacterium]|nr:LptA/OstA family protein [Verrucomicrobiae bacterium]